MARRSVFPPARGRQTSRRLTAWDMGTGGTATLTVTGPGPFFLGSAISLVAGVSALTIVRTRGEFKAYLTAATARSDGFQGAFGIGIATLAAVTAGIASVPTPITEADSDNWLYHRFFGCQGSDVISGGAATDSDQANVVTAALRVEVDSKAMRKMTDESAIYSCIEIVEFGAATMVLTWDSRILAKLA